MHKVNDCTYLKSVKKNRNHSLLEKLLYKPKTKSGGKKAHQKYGKKNTEEKVQAKGMRFVQPLEALETWKGVFKEYTATRKTRSSTCNMNNVADTSSGDESDVIVRPARLRKNNKRKAKSEIYTKKQKIRCLSKIEIISSDTNSCQHALSKRKVEMTLSSELE